MTFVRLQLIPSNTTRSFCYPISDIFLLMVFFCLSFSVYEIKVTVITRIPVSQVNEAFEVLKRRTCPIRAMNQSPQNPRTPPSVEIDPVTAADGQSAGNNAGPGRMPKVEILRNAIEYIAYLEDMLRARTPASSFGTTRSGVENGRRLYRSYLASSSSAGKYGGNQNNRPSPQDYSINEQLRRRAYVS